MSLSFSKAVCGEEICFWDSKPLHSTFNPVTEAQRFISILNFTSPAYIIFLGPCLPFCLPFLRKKYPNTKIIAVQYFTGLPKKQDSWDNEIILSSAESTGESLYGIIGEEYSNSIEVISWNTCERLFHNSYITACEAVKIFLLKSRDLLATRIFFSKRWFKNTINFFNNISKICLPVCGTSPVLITASGPSLDACITTIIQKRKKLFIIALSSSLSILAHHHIIPDLCVSTDGGYWAQKHLSSMNNVFNQPLAVSAESYVPKSILNNSIILPLNYGDGFSSVLFNTVSIPYTPAVRNGTVSGTALFLAKLLTTGPVFFAGLDLSSAKGYQHSQPNLLEKAASITDTRLSNSQTRTAAQEINSRGSLHIYEQWFKLLQSGITKNLYRLKPSDSSLHNQLGTVQDVSLEQFLSILSSSQDLKPSFTIYKTDECRSILEKKIDSLLSLLKNISYKNPHMLIENTEIIELAKSASLQKYLAFTKNYNEESFTNLLEELQEVLKTASSLMGVNNDI